MKNYLIISLLFLSLGFSQKEYNVNDLILMDNGLTTEKFSDEPITGKVYGNFGEKDNLKKVYIGNLLKGKEEGRWKLYYSNGKKSFDSNFKDGELNGLRTSWYENGKKRFEETYKDGEKEGLFANWYENGQIRTEGVLNDGKEDGLITTWYENGKKKDEVTYKDGRKDGLSTEWYENGQINHKTYFLNNMKDGKETTYYFDNDYIKSGVSKNKSGDIHTIIEYKKDKKHGIFLKYHEKKLVIKRTYKNDKFIDEESFE